MEVYRHKPTGNLYEKLYDAVAVDMQQSVVVYRSMKDNKVWVRDSEIFNKRFEKFETEINVLSSAEIAAIEISEKKRLDAFWEVRG